MLTLRFGAELEPREWLRERGPGAAGGARSPGHRELGGTTGAATAGPPVNQEEAGPVLDGSPPPPARAEVTHPELLTLG